MIKRILLTVFLFSLYCLSNVLFAQATQTFTANGTWICPAGVTTITVQCWGGGGGGGGGNNGGRGAGGGGGGAFASNNAVAVTAGTSYAIVVGAGGGGGNNNDGSNGGNSTFNATTVVAAGGSAGQRGNPGAGGAGGTVAASTGTTEFAGGNGANGSNGAYGGGGGGGAGTGGGATNATNQNGTAGIAVGGGNGGNGATAGNTNGSAGNSFGGGGGGARGNADGADGADGRVIVSWTIPNENCASAASLTSGINCVTSVGNSNAATGSGVACGIGNADDDLWFSFVAVATTHTVTVDGAANYDAVIGAYNSCGGAQPTGGACVNATGADGIETLTLTGLTIGNTYFIEAHDNAAGGGDFTICVTHLSVPACAGSLTSSSTCPPSVVLDWTAPSTVANSAATSYLLFFGTDNPPTNMVNGTNIGNVLTYTQAGLSSSTTYFWQIVPTNAQGNASGCSIQSFSEGATPVNDDPCSATVITAGTSCSYVTYTNACATTTVAGAPPAPGCAGYSGGDVWFTVTAPSSFLTFDTQSGVMTDGGMAVYRGNCGALTLIACDDNSGTGAMPQISRTDLIPGETIWIRMWENGNNNNGTFGLCVWDACGSSPSNDMPCNATAITLGTIAAGDNTCAGIANEPAAPGCWDGNTRNTVWYSFVAPGTGSVKIRTAPGSLAATQINLYSGVCGASLVSVSCNDNAPACGSTGMAISEITAAGLTAGNTYYVAVDGNGAAVGTFAITVVEGSATYPASSGQACGTNISVCNSTISIGNPGYQGVGFTCDDTGGSNCTTGERGSSWYTINIASPGTLLFNIIPNNYNGVNCTGESDYDFVLWKIAGAGATDCATISSSGGAGSVACNFDGQGVTGLSTDGTATASGFNACFNNAFEPGIAVVAGEVYALLIENFSGSTAGYTLDLSSVAAGTINYTPPTAVTWTGGANSTAADNVVNWGGCSLPSCTVDATVSPSSAFQPLITAAMGTVNVKDLTIDPGGVLTLGANSVLKICGNLTNNGTITADPTSTILFNDDLTTHTINGSLTAGNKLGGLTVTDVAGGTNCTVTLNAKVEISGDFTTSSSTSIFNTNGFDVTLGGDFSNASASTTFSGVVAATEFTFNGSSAQTYSPGGALTLSNVIVDHSGPGVTISATGTPNLILGTSGVLTLSNGKIITPGNQEVQVTNTSTAAVSAGSPTSFIEGNLRRYLAAGATGSFDFPVGHSVKGYQRANVNFTTAAAAGAIQLLARFDDWGGAFPLPGAPGWGPECGGVFYDQPYLDNGYWSIDASGASTGLYDLTLYNLNYTNQFVGYSIAKSPSGGPAWALAGTCVPSGAPTAVTRNGITGFSKFATIQSNSILPVELTVFKGKNVKDHNEINWESISEDNFNRYELESSQDAFVFKSIHTKNGTGNSNSLKKYSFKDFNFFTPITYYRLKSIDNDGKFEYSPIIYVQNEQEAFNVTSIFPNPASNEVNINVTSPNDVEVSIEISDILGRKISTSVHKISSGYRSILLNISELKTGSYTISCKVDGLPEINNSLIISK